MHIDERLVSAVTSWSEVLQTSEALQTGYQQEAGMGVSI